MKDDEKGVGQVTQLIRKWQQDHDAEAENQLFTLVNDELKQIANRQRRGLPRIARKIEPAELISEAWMKFRNYPIDPVSRGPFFMLMTRGMRQHLIDLARRSGAGRRPHSTVRVLNADPDRAFAATDEVDILWFYESLDALRAMGEREARQADTLEYSAIGGMTIAEIADTNKTASVTVKRDLAKARSFISFQLQRGTKS